MFFVGKASFNLDEDQYNSQKHSLKTRIIIRYDSTLRTTLGVAKVSSFLLKTGSGPIHSIKICFNGVGQKSRVLFNEVFSD
jgi:hypothetical protein